LFFDSAAFAMNAPAHPQPLDLALSVAWKYGAVALFISAGDQDAVRIVKIRGERLGVRLSACFGGGKPAFGMQLPV
jgi:hypothetical protein